MDLLNTIKIRNRLALLKSSPEIQTAVSEQRDAMLSTVESISGCQNYLRLITNSYESVLAERDKLETNVELLVKKLSNDINHYARENYSNLEYSHIEKTSTFDSEVVAHLSGRISMYADWKYPALKFNCFHPEVIECMTASDPLYVLSSSTGESSQILRMFSADYQKRLRMYTLNNIRELPQEQFSLIVSINHGNYLNPQELSNYLSEMFLLLRTGGTILFTYNNCELESSAVLANEKIMAWNTETDLKRTINDLGYELINSVNVNNSHQLVTSVSWLEIKKPGQLTTQKEHQVLGKIEKK